MTQANQKTGSEITRVLNAAVVIGALGYFVDIYDLVLFSIVRVSSLKGLGVTPDKLFEVGVYLLNMQMMGMLIGGILWGIFGDKRGRIFVLFGSIFLYSIANLANAFVTTIPMYGALRFIAGLGLAGELGAAITLVSEVMTKETRGYGTAIVASVGICGAVAAGLIGEFFTWQTAYLVGGCLGIVLLIARIRIYESGMFAEVKKTEAKRGDLVLLFKSPARVLLFLRCILIGVPIWYVIGVLVTFSPEISLQMHVTEPVTAGRSILFTYIGLAAGDLLSGVFSQIYKSRKKIVFAFLILTALSVSIYLASSGITPTVFYALCILMGFATGYWAVFVTIASEQFGTNLRATVTTSVPNFVRGAVVPMTLFFHYIARSYGLIQSAVYLGLGVMICAFLALKDLPETFGKDLNYLE